MYAFNKYEKRNLCLEWLWILDENLPLIIRYQETPTPAIEFRDLSPVTIAQN